MARQTRRRLAVGVGVGRARVPGAQQAGQRLGQDGHVGDGQVEALGPGGRHDVRRVPGQEQPPVTHGRGDEAAHRRDGLLGDRAVLQLPARDLQPVPQLGPDPVVGPALDVVLRAYLQVQPADLRGAHGVQREPVLVARVDELVGGRRHRGQDAEPGVRVAALGHLDQAGRHGVAADAVESVAAGDHVAADLVPRPRRVGVAQHRPVLSRSATSVPDTSNSSWAAGRQPGLDQVLDDLGLRVDRHPAAAGQVAEVEMVPLPRELQVDPAVLETLGVHPLRPGRPHGAARPCRPPAARRAAGPRSRPGCGSPPRSSRCRAGPAGETAAARPARPRRCRPACAG